MAGSLEAFRLFHGRDPKTNEKVERPPKTQDSKDEASTSTDASSSSTTSTEDNEPVGDVSTMKGSTAVLADGPDVETLDESREKRIVSAKEGFRVTYL